MSRPSSIHVIQKEVWVNSIKHTTWMCVPLGSDKTSQNKKLNAEKNIYFQDIPSIPFEFAHWHCIEFFFVVSNMKEPPWAKTIKM